MGEEEEGKEGGDVHFEAGDRVGGVMWEFGRSDYLAQRMLCNILRIKGEYINKIRGETTIEG